MKRNLIQMSRDRRVPQKLDMGLPKRKTAAQRRWAQLVRRLVDPKFYLSVAMACSLVALVFLPAFCDGTLALVRPLVTQHGSCRILRVIDGDTASMWCDDRGIRSVRFTGYDTPELHNPSCLKEFAMAVQAKWQLRLVLWRGSRIEARHLGTDRYGRDLKAIFVDGTLLADQMVHTGLARRYDGSIRRGWCAKPTPPQDFTLR